MLFSSTYSHELLSPISSQMIRSPLLRWSIIAPLATLFVPIPVRMSPIDPVHCAGLVWRNIGPLRGGRIAAVSGVIGQPGVFYVGLPAGGVSAPMFQIGQASPYIPRDLP